MSKQPTATFVLVTPDRAAQWLKANTANRRPRPTVVEFMTKEMRRGQWVTTHQGVAFADTGELIDGQHRLMAIVASGIPQMMLVVRDLPMAAKRVIDLHQRRSPADLLGIGKPLSEVARFVAEVCMRTQRITANDISPYVDLIAPGMAALLEACGSAKATRSSVGVRAAFILRAMYEPDRAAEIYTQYRAFILLDLETMQHGLKLLLRQIDQKRTADTSDRTTMFVRTWQAIDVGARGISRIQVRVKRREEDDARAGDMTIKARRIMDELGLGSMSEPAEETKPEPAAQKEISL